MNERHIIAALIQSRAAYASVSVYHEEGDFSDLAELIYKELIKYYEKDSDATHMSTSSLLSRLKRLYPKRFESFEKFINDMKSVSISNIMDDYYAMKADSLGEMAGSYLIAGEHSKAAPLIEKYVALQAEGLQAKDDAPIVYADADVDNFAESLTVANRIPIAPRDLNVMFGGGLIPGSHLLVYAPPEVGKTAFAINLAYSTACNKRRRKGNKTLYIGNEEAADMYLMRLLCRFTQWEEEEVQANRMGAMKLARKRGWSNLTFVHLSPGTVAQVQKLILDIKPDVVIIDQLHNLMLGKGKEPEKTQLLERLAYAMRMFYSRHKIAGVSLSQADEKAIGKLYLTIKDIYYSNIGVQGQTDAMIGIGMNREYELQGRRVLNVTKNKLGGEHGAIVVIFNNKISAFKSIGN